MDWCCSRCGHRQVAEASCGNCGQESVHDLRSRATRDLFDGIEGRHREAVSSRALKLAAIATLLVFGGLNVLLYVINLRFTQYGAGLVAGATGLGIWQFAERKLHRPKFPFLADLPPADRP